jgi:pimeloyl-ACP methyl ester carboxylesterase
LSGVDVDQKRSVRAIFLSLAGALLLLPGLAAGTVAIEIPCSEHSDPRLASMTDDGIESTSFLGLASGRYALPQETAPTTLVVMFHGHGNDSCSWRNHLRQAAAEGAVAIAMDYTGQRQTPVENYGWFVKEGAADSIAAAKYFLAAYPSISRVIALGISMGGHAAGLAVASPDAVRGDGAPLFDYLIDIEGVNNVVEEYLVARGVAPVDSGGALTQQEMEEEYGGSLEAVTQNYLDSTLTLRASDMAALNGAVVVNAVDDGLVPTDQSPQFAVALTAAGIPTHSFTVVGSGGAEPGTTASAIVAGPVFAAAGQQYTSPFAGHGWEGSDTQLVVKTGFDQLFALLGGGSVDQGETVVPGV